MGTNGLCNRYEVRKVSDPTGKHKDCKYLVLDPQHDPIAREAIRLYAGRTWNLQLSNDLNDWLNEIEGKNHA